MVRRSAERLAELLGESMAADGDPADVTEEAKRDFLLLQLARVVSAQPHQPTTVGQALLDRHTPVDLLEGIKEDAKHLSARRDRPVEHDVGTALYYAAIAAAMALHGRKITSWADGDLARALGAVAAKPWVVRPLREILEQARALCEAGPRPADEAGSAPLPGD